MGNANNKSTFTGRSQSSFFSSTREPRAFSSQFSLSHFGNLSGRSFASVTSNQSVYSASRPWSRVSRRRWNESTLNSPLEASKTAWPVANKESIFLPEFPITTDLQQKQFVIIKTIAKGAFGEVYRVNNTKENKEYALKALNKSQVVSENAIRQVKEEARIQAAVGHHTFIAGAVARWQTKKRLYIVSEYIPGGELLALLDRHVRLPEELVKLFVAEIAIAIDFLHNAGIIYRDLKPENILLDADYHIKLIDFGLSKWLTIGSRTTTVCGTLKYMAPEILQREAYNHAVDWWSLGVVACRMLTGEFPTPAAFPEATNAARELKDVTEDLLAMNLSESKISKPVPGTLPESAENLSTAARGLLMRLLECDPKVRLRSLRQLQQTAFYMGYNIEKVRSKQIEPPKSILERHLPLKGSGLQTEEENLQGFKEFDRQEYFL
ncbi:serine/threonine-protein kinase S6KL isoform X1 [Aricia agestis]|uniref:serine/threonine-protein kinase S6KL isoform X1 n=1 Tax=Aricia agestis TaxID=91739 RepID=UPI001C206A7E|nr:serine/threonine-protein kinase S6KL isoform X1 [Aricia agestis]